MTTLPAQTTGEPHAAAPQVFPLGHWAPLAAALSVYVVLALWLAATKAPWCDEGAFANPAYNLAFHGYMGSNVLEPSGHLLNAYLRGIQQRMYIMVPNHLVALAGWYRIVGFSVFKTRLYSILWGTLTLPLWFYILRRFFPDRKVAQVCVLLLAFDFIFLWCCADGRMDAPASALALCAMAAYLHVRERSIAAAVLISQAFGAAAVFTHPNAALALLPLAVLAWRWDRKRFTPRHLALAAVPYLFFAGLWSFYILQNPADFAAQFFANAAGPRSYRWKIVLQPWLAVWKELERQLGAYAAGGLWSAWANPWMDFVPVGYLAALIWLLRNRRRCAEPLRAFLICTMVLIAAMTFLNGFKAHFYMIYLIPYYDAALAAWLLKLWAGAADSKCVAAAIAAGFVLVHVSTSVQHIRADEYRRDYLPVIQDVAQYRASGKTIVGTSALGFGTNFEGFRDDARMGLYSGLTPDVLVVDRAYREFARVFEREEPQVLPHVVATLTTQYRMVRQHGSFWIFERVTRPLDGGLAPWIDASGIDSMEKDKRVEYLFTLIAAHALAQKSYPRSSS